VFATSQLSASPSVGARQRRVRTTTVKVLMVAPALALFITFYLTPVVAGVVLSFFQWNGLTSPRYVGFANYDRLLTDPVFLDNVKITLIVVLVSLLVILPLALLCAVCLSGPAWVLPIFRWILFVPVVMPLGAIALLWSEIFNPVNGLANRLLDKIGIEPVTWLGEPTSALYSLIAVSVWGFVGLHIVIQLSALSAIPADLKEAARLETPSVWRVFRHVVLPLLRAPLTVSAVLTITGTFVYFTSISFVMTKGGPVHGTEVLGLRAYLEGFSAANFGLASAITTVTMLITILLIGGTLLFGARSRVEY